MSPEDAFAKKIISYLDEEKSNVPPSIEARLALAREKAIALRKKEEVAPQLAGWGVLSLGKHPKFPWLNSSLGVLATGVVFVAFMLYNFTSLFSLYPTQQELSQSTPAYQRITQTLGSWNKYEQNMEEDLSSLDAYVLYQAANDSE